MKKLFALLLVAALLVTLGACAAKEPNNTASDSSATETVDPLTLLETVWNSFSEDEKFPAVGGDLSEENLKDGAPGKYVITDAAELARVMGFPQTEVASVKAAASLTHMMNANTFTCGALRVKNGDDAAKLAEDLRDAIQNKQWMCGFPDKLVIATLGNYVVSVYGDEELVNTFRDKLQAAYSDAAIAYDEMIGEGEFSDGEDTALEAPVA